METTLDKTILTYSALRKFRNCRKKYYWRCVRELVPLERKEALWFGSLIHGCLELWHSGRIIEEVFDYIDKQTELLGDNGNHKDNDTRLKATAMMTAYVKAYPEGSEWFKVLALEQTFQQPIINPMTQRSSRSFVLAGKVDGVIEKDGELWLLEHKTAGKIDRGYLDRLWTDTQILLYSFAIEEMYDRPVKGIVYNILTKAKLQQGKGETEQEYLDRKAALIAKSKSGASKAQQKHAEPDEVFSARLADKYQEPDMFHREEIILDRGRYDELAAELWELTKAFLDARNRDMYYCNTDQCNHYNSMCGYFRLCSARSPELIAANEFRHEPAHIELMEESK